ncbi:hypothetical protein [Nannocystis pusilla]|uniref:hypothetical protein n=1 Tax=Nannocystis pusilla TaxID=889268 RepID=UPI003DA66FA2
MPVAAEGRASEAGATRRVDGGQSWAVLLKLQCQTCSQLGDLAASALVSAREAV